MNQNKSRVLIEFKSFAFTTAYSHDGFAGRTLKYGSMCNVTTLLNSFPMITKFNLDLFAHDETYESAIKCITK